jgi:hypothetical protein
MNIEKIKDVAEAFFTFIRYTLFMIFGFIGVLAFLFALAFFIGTIGGYPYAFTGFCISFGSFIISIIIGGLLNVEPGEWATFI